MPDRRAGGRAGAGRGRKQAAAGQGRRITVRVPPTFFKPRGLEFNLDLPLAPRPTPGFLALAIAVPALAIAMILFAMVLPATRMLLGTDTGEASGPRTPALFFVLVGALALLFLAPFVEGLAAALLTLRSRQPVLEIRPEGLVDCRVLKRMVRWDEFEDVGDKGYAVNRLNWPKEYSFRLKDPALRRLSPFSFMQSLGYGGKRAAIMPFGFDLPPRVILDVIVAMIREVHAAPEAGKGKAGKDV